MRIIELIGDVGIQITAEKLKAHLGNKNDDVTIKLDSYGGDFFEGIRIGMVIEDYQGAIVIETGAVVASAASFAMLFAQKVITRPESAIMFHRAWTITIGNADDFKDMVDFLGGADSLQVTKLSNRLKLKKNKIIKMLSEEIWFWGGQSLIDAGLADEMKNNNSTEEIDPPASEDMQAEISKEVKALMHKFESPQGRDFKKITAQMRTIKANKREFPVKNKKEEADMTLEEVFAKYPDTKADYETRLLEAKADGVDEKTILATERERVNKILGSSKKVNDVQTSAIEDGLTYADYCVKVVEEQPKPQANGKKIGDISQQKGDAETADEIEKDTQSGVNQSILAKIAPKKEEK